ncbi:MAG: hypothetical protein AB7O64_20345, partial [Methylibium sp.]
ANADADAQRPPKRSQSERTAMAMLAREQCTTPSQNEGEEPTSEKTSTDREGVLPAADEKSPPDKPAGFAFVGRVVRLKQADFDQWSQTYAAVPDFRAELQAADDYYAQNPPKGGKWYFAVSNWLKKANADALERRKREGRGREWAI